LIGTVCRYKREKAQWRETVGRYNRVSAERNGRGTLERTVWRYHRTEQHKRGTKEGYSKEVQRRGTVERYSREVQKRNTEERYSRVV
jgi:hypothetical protein